jgi:hypothetical protein
MIRLLRRKHNHILHARLHIRHTPRMDRLYYLCISVLIILAACQPTPGPAQSITTRPSVSLSASATPPPSASPTLTPTPQLRLNPVPYGPELDSFPEDVNPLTGWPVQDASLLKLPAVLVSISNMPVTARPQAGIGFASWIFELFIGEGATRFMGVFYGDYPHEIPNVNGSCPVRTEITHPADPWVGDRVWLDENADGHMDAWETGVGGLCVNLYSADGGLLQSTSTDSNGYYGFEVQPDVAYFIEFIPTDKYVDSTHKCNFAGRQKR